MAALRAAPIAVLILLLWTCACAGAAVPSHPRVPTLDVNGLNHACGATVDSKGDLYLSSAGAAKILIFAPADHETPIGEIANAKEPCGLAVDTKGNLYVSEQGTGEVVRYKPTEYPFSGAPSYGPREVIDSSGQAKGISVDPFDNRLYVAEGTRVSTYESLGNLGENEKQRINCLGCTTGTYKLLFKGEETTKSIPFEGPASAVEEALLELASIDPGDVSVKNGANNKIHLITFTGKYAHTDVEALLCKPAGIDGSCNVVEEVKGFSGHIGEGSLTKATGVAAYTYEIDSEKRTYHLAVADAAGAEVKLFSAESPKAQKLRATLTGPAAGEEFGFGAAGAYLGTDQGTCPPAGEAACTAGHLFLYDDAHQQIDELEANGALVSRTPFAFGDGVPTAFAVDRSGTAANGTLYATSGAGAGARALAFGPLRAPSRPGPIAEEDLSLVLPKAALVAIDAYGNRYVAVGPEVIVYPPSGKEALLKVALGEQPRQIAVDSAGNLYAALKEKAVYFHPASFPPVKGTVYGAAVQVAKQSEFPGEAIRSLGVNPANDHLFVINSTRTVEYDSAANGSKVLNPDFGAGLIPGGAEGVAVYGANGNVYISTGSGGGRVYVLDPQGKERLSQITGAGSPAGSFGAAAGAIAVDQSNGHVLAFEPGHQDIEEYESSGTFVTAFGSFATLVTLDYGVAVDNGAHSPHAGDVFLAYDDPKGAYDLWGFGGLGYPATAPLPEFLLSVAREGTGSGTVTSVPTGIDCGLDCSEKYEEGTTVILTATPEEGSKFTGWSGACAGTGSCKVTMDEARSVTATFAKEEVVEPGIALTVSLEGTGSGTVTSSPGLISCNPFCSDEFPKGTKVTLTASPTAGSLFMAWKHCDTGGISGRTCTVTMDKAKAVQALFVTAHLLSVAKAEGSGPGKVSATGGLTCLYACTQTSSLVKEGTAVTVKETPAKHFHFAGWGGDCSGTGACELIMGEDHEVTADFEEDPKFSLSLSKSGGGQALIKTKPAGVLCGYTCTEAVASFYEGEAITVSWKLNKGTTKLTWSKGAGTCTGVFVTLEGACTMTMDAAKSLLASLE